MTTCYVPLSGDEKKIKEVNEEDHKAYRYFSRGDFGTTNYSSVG